MCNLTIVCVMLLAVFSSAQDTTKPNGTVCWQLHFSGVSVGVTEDDQLQRLMGGAGVFRSNEGHTGGRYYVDEKGEFTLHIEEGVDRVVESITVSKGVNRKFSAFEQNAAVSKWFYPKEGFGNWRALHLGSDTQEVRENLGEPKEKQKGGSVWVYESTCSCEIPNELSIEFHDGKVTEIVFSEGE